MENRLWTLIKQGNNAIDEGNGKAALKLYQEALKTAQKHNYPEFIMLSLNNIGFIYELWGNYEEAIKNYRQSLRISKQINSKQGESKNLNNIGGIYNLRGLYEEAIDYYHQSLQIAKEIGDKQGEGRTLNNIGDVYNSRGNFKMAINYFLQSLEIQKEIGDELGESASLNNIGMVYEAWGKLLEAISYFNQALQISKKIKDQQGVCTALNNVGLVYQVWGRYKEAINYFSLSLQIQKNINDFNGEGVSLSNIGMVYTAWGKNKKALKFFQQSLEIFSKIGNKKGKGGILNNIGGIFESWGEYDKASEFYSQSLEISEEIGDARGESFTLNNFGSLYELRGDYRKAINYFQQSLQILKNLGDKQGEGILLSNIGMVFRSYEKYQEAIKFFTKSHQILKEIGDKKGMSVSISNTGLVYEKWGKSEEAINHFSQALQIQEEIGDRRGESVSLNNIGLVFSKMKSYKESIKYFDRSLQILKEIGDRGGEVICLSNLGFNHGIQKQFSKASIYLKKSIDISEELIGETMSEEIRKIYRGTALGPYKAIIELLLDWYNYDSDKQHLLEGLRFLDLTKAREIVDKLENQKILVDTCPELEYLINEEGKLISEMMDLQFIVKAETQKGIYKSTSFEALIERGKNLKVLRKDLMEKCKDPGMIRLTKAYNPIPDFHEIFKYKGIIIWEFIYFPDLEPYKDYFYILVWDGNNIEVLKSNKFEKDTILKLMHEFYVNLAREEENFLNNAVENLKKLQNCLRDLLTGDLLRTLETKKKLILVPHDILHLFPWEIVKEIGLKIPIVRSYSLSLLRSCMKRELEMDNILLIANPNFNLEDDELPGTEEEVDSICQLLHERETEFEILRHEEATKSEFTNLVKQEFGIIHFAGHGVYDPVGEDPWMSGLLFYYPERSDLYTVTEIVTQRFKGTPLFILSACETGRAQLSKGDELVGLIRGLTLAGVSSIIATNWKLSDEVAPHFMKLFYKEFLRGKDVCESLFEARKKIYAFKGEAFKNPLYWGVYTIYGNPFKRFKS